MTVTESDSHLEKVSKSEGKERGEVRRGLGKRLSLSWIRVGEVCPQEAAEVGGSKTLRKKDPEGKEEGIPGRG